MSLHLNEDELYEMTGYRQRKRQYAALAELRVPFKPRPADGFPLVERWRFQAPTAVKKSEPNFGASYG
jgi:hypothetical protein